MTRKKKLKISDEVEVRYSNWMAQLIAVMQPWSLYWIAGRASAKTVQVLAERVQEVAQDCPGAPFAWVAICIPICIRMWFPRWWTIVGSWGGAGHPLCYEPGTAKRVARPHVQRMF